MSKKTTSTTALAAGLTAGLLGGAAAGMIFGIPGVTGASSPAVVQQSDEDTGTDEDTGSDEDVGTDETSNEEWAEEAVGRVREALQPLVDDGTLRATQADEVAEFLVENRPERGGRFGKGGPMGHHGRGGGSESMEVLEDALDMEAEEIREALADGSTLADLADDPQALIDDLVAEAESRLDEAVADGHLDEDEAAEKKAELTERITDRVNGELPERGEFHGRGGFPGPSESDDSSTEEED